MYLLKISTVVTFSEEATKGINITGISVYLVYQQPTVVPAFEDHQFCLKMVLNWKCLLKWKIFTLR